MSEWLIEQVVLPLGIVCGAVATVMVVAVLIAAFAAPTLPPFPPDYCKDHFCKTSMGR